MTTKDFPVSTSAAVSSRRLRCGRNAWTQSTASGASTHPGGRRLTRGGDGGSPVEPPEPSRMKSGRNRWFVDSSLGQAGFELSVPPCGAADTS